MDAKLCFALIAAAMLTGCAALTANAPLFLPADQVGPAPLAEGVWIQINEHCPERNARRTGRLPRECYPAELRRAADGAWSFSFQEHVRMESDASPRALRLVIAPATERQPSDAYVSLYLAEYTPLETSESQDLHYAVIVPVGTLPAEEFYVVGQIGCSEILRDGPIEGVTETHDEATGNLTGCVAADQAAVREAARRSVIEQLSELLSADSAIRLLFVRP